MFYLHILLFLKSLCVFSFRGLQRSSLVKKMVQMSSLTSKFESYKLDQFPDHYCELDSSIRSISALPLNSHFYTAASAVIEREITRTGNLIAQSAKETLADLAGLIPLAYQYQAPCRELAAARVLAPPPVPARGPPPRPLPPAADVCTEAVASDANARRMSVSSALSEYQNPRRASMSGTNGSVVDDLLGLGRRSFDGTGAGDDDDDRLAGTDSAGPSTDSEDGGEVVPQRIAEMARVQNSIIVPLTSKPRTSARPLQLARQTVRSVEGLTACQQANVVAFNTLIDLVKTRGKTLGPAPVTDVFDPLVLTSSALVNPPVLAQAVRLAHTLLDLTFFMPGDLQPTFFETLITGETTSSHTKTADIPELLRRRRRTFRFGLAAGLIVVATVITMRAISLSTPLWSSTGFGLALPVFAAPLLAVLCVVAWGVDTLVFRMRGLRYTECLSIDGPQAPAQILFGALLYLAGLAGLFALFVIYYSAEVRTNTGSITSAGIVCLATLLYAIVVGAFPHPFLAQPSRLRVAKISLKFLILPFTEVAFVHGFIADIMTSLAQMYKYVAAAACHTLTGVYSAPTFGPGAVSPAQCITPANLAANLVAMLPYIWRLLQCLNRAFVTRQSWPHLANAGKYITSIAALIFAALKDLETDPALAQTWTTVWCVVVVVSTLYSYTWDITMDWSLIERKSGGERGVQLRHRRYFPKMFYIAVAVINLALRCAWATSLMPAVVAFFPASPAHKLALAVLEVVRRFLWAILRIENEHLARFGKF